MASQKADSAMYTVAHTAIRAEPWRSQSEPASLRLGRNRAFGFYQ